MWVSYLLDTRKNRAEMIAISGYAIQEKMRHNRNIDTYYALRQKDKRKVLLKIPNNHYQSSENLAVLQHEFHLLRKINCPTIIKAYDFLQNMNAPVLILEGVEGSLLRSYLNTEQIEISDFLVLALQLVDIVAELHQRKIIHKEIKPANIIINPEKLTLKLIDLSASTKLSEETFDYQTLNNFEDSLSYISPEQTGRINRPVDYRTDFYSLGITLFQMLTNQLPFQATEPLELVHCHIAKKPPTALEIRPNTPKILSAIIDKLLQKMPEERYSSIIGLKSDLKECQKQWETKGTINQFLLGLNDTKERLNISHNLYGREQQVNQLLEAYHRISRGNKEMIFIAGYSGVGKTSLVREVHKPIIQSRGYYIQGKFDQLQQNIPYSAIVVAFQHLVKQVLAENESRLQELRAHLITALGNVGQVVIDVIPEVELIIGHQPPVHKLNPIDAQIRFNLVFQNFVRVFAQSNHPLVIFLDDLQWADNSSLNFIENVLQDQDTAYLLIIGAYRDNEIDMNHPLQMTIDNFRKNKIDFTTLKLKNLQLKDIQQLLQDTLSCSQERIKDLAKCTFDKTHGNPFFISQFIKILHQEKILNFSYENGAWCWDLLRIQQQSATANVIELLSNKIHLLPSGTQEILKLASCFGHEFDFKTLLTISGFTVSQTAEQLEQAIKSDLIYPLEETYKTLGLVGLGEIINERNISALHYRFAHDRVQQAIYGLIDAKDKPNIHLKIGRLLLKEKTLEEKDERLFIVMKHFNHSLHLINSANERLRLAKYNLWAGQKAKSASAYFTANEYLSAGISLLKTSDWKKDYKLVFQIYKELAVCKYLIGDFTSADYYFSELLKHENNTLDSLEIYRLKIEMLSTLAKHNEALQIGLMALRRFGIKIPVKPNKINLLSAIYRIKFQIRNTKIENIDLPMMTDLKYRAIADLITQLLNSAFITNQQLFILLICKNISLSFKYGYTESTSTCIPVYAFVIMHSLGLYDEAISFVKLYNNLKQRYGASNFEGKNQFVLGSFIEPYQLPINTSNKTITKAFRLCCEVGDLVYSNYSNLLLVLHALSAGNSLSDVKKNIQVALSFMSRVNISDFITVAKFWDYSIQCLENPDLAKLEQSASFEEIIAEGKNKTELSFFYSTMTRFHFLLGNFEDAINIGTQYEIYADYDKGLISHFDAKFFYVLSLFYSFPNQTRSKRNDYLKKLNQLVPFIEKYAAWCPQNFKAHSLLIAAEFAHLRAEHQHTLSLYEQAIESALSQGLILIAAIANESAGRHCISIGTERIAKLYLQNAYCYFKEWGVTTRLQLLEETYPALTLAKDDLTVANTNPLATTQNLDMLAILKFTQLISSEIRLDKLLQKFMVIVLETAGAQSSIILTKIHDEWIIEAEGNMEQQVVYLNQLKRAEGSLKYPHSILNYVQRTQKSIIVNDAMQSELYFNDHYIQQENPRSILMIPLFYKGQLSRVLYLEHKSSSYTFTTSHLDSLQLLSSQAMTSLENAKLYYQATHDPLTGLANRNMLYDLFEQTTNQLMNPQTKVALLFLDLDYFKVINDTLGHDNGDRLLVHIAKTLAASLREGDVAARIGGDEFAVMLNNVSTEKLSIIIERLFHELSKPIRIDDHLMQITASMGISVFPKDGQNIQTLLKLADTALYQAKEKGRNQFHYYSTASHEEYQRIHGLDKELQRAYANEEFFLMYQPFYDAQSGKIIGFETLLRWNHPERGVLEADVFIGTLEKSPLIIPVSEWLLKAACRQAKIWQNKKIFSGSIAINISTVQFIRHSLSELVAKTLAETQLSASSIELEITETIFIDYCDNLYDEIDKLQALGINLVMDDFGTGYSSLAYLKHLPIHKIKIDKVFIKDCERDYLDQAIINAIITMAHKLDIKVIAEGVENETQLNILKAQGIDGIQGYYYSRPLTIEGCETYLKRKNLED